MLPSGLLSKAGIRKLGLGEMKSLAGTVSRWHLSGQAGLEGESNAQVDEEKDLRFDTVTT